MVDSDDDAEASWYEPRVLYPGRPSALPCAGRSIPVGSAWV